MTLDGTNVLANFARGNSNGGGTGGGGGGIYATGGSTQLLDGTTVSGNGVELATYSLGVLAFTLLLERRLVTEMFGYLRGRRATATA